MIEQTDDFMRIIAWHECGHAAAAVVMGGRLSHVSVNPLMQMGQAVFTMHDMEPMQRAIVSLAGPEASKVVTVPDHYLSLLAAGDVATAYTYAIIHVAKFEQLSTDPEATIRDTAAIMGHVQRAASEFVATFVNEIAAAVDAILAAPGRTLTGGEFAAAAGGYIAEAWQPPEAADGSQRPNDRQHDELLTIGRCHTCNGSLGLTASVSQYATLRDIDAILAAVNANGCRCQKNSYELVKGEN